MFPRVKTRGSIEANTRATSGTGICFNGAKELFNTLACCHPSFRPLETTCAEPLLGEIYYFLLLLSSISARSLCWDLDPFISRSSLRLFVARVDVTSDSD